MSEQVSAFFAQVVTHASGYLSFAGDGLAQIVVGVVVMVLGLWVGPLVGAIFRIPVGFVTGTDALATMNGNPAKVSKRTKLP